MGATYTFVGAVGAFMLFLLDLPIWVLILMIVVLILLGAFVTGYFRKRRASEPQGPE